MSKSKGLTNRSLSALPILLMGVTHLSLPPLQSMFELEPLLMYGYYAVALVLAAIVYRRSGVVKDYEYNRAKAMKKIKHVYEAEERGVWSTDAHLDGAMDTTTQLGLSRSVGELSGEAPEMELSEDSKVEVRMLNEADHIVKANARVTGSAAFEDEAITGTIGAQRKAGPMDRLLDAVFGWFGYDSRAVRESQRQARLRGAASAAPVTAQRPVAPLRFDKTQDESEVNMTSMSDSGGVETVMSTSGQVRNESAASAAPTVGQSLESMAMLGESPASASNLTTAGPKCPGCGGAVSPADLYCPHCGLDL